MKSFGLLSFLFFGAGIVYMLARWPADTSKTYSQNAARSRESILFYMGLVLFFLALLSVFTFGWLIPSLHLSVAFTTVFTIGVLAEAIAAVIPETHGIRAMVHCYSAGVMYLASLAIVGFLALGVPTPASQFVIIALFVMAATVVLAVLSKKVRKHAVVLQTIHLSALVAAFMFATYRV